MTDREHLAAKVRLLVGRSYKRAADRQWMRDQGFDVPDPQPHSWEAFEDHVFQTFKKADGQRTERHLRVLDGGREITKPVVGRRPGPEASSQTAAVGDKPPFPSGVEVAGLPTNFNSEGETA